MKILTVETEMVYSDSFFQSMNLDITFRGGQTPTHLSITGITHADLCVVDEEDSINVNPEPITVLEANEILEMLVDIRDDGPDVLFTISEDCLILTDKQGAPFFAVYYESLMVS